LNTDNESLPMTDAGSEFQTDGTAHLVPWCQNDQSFGIY